MSDPRFHAVMPFDQLREGSMRACEISGREILLCKTRDRVYALDNICTHAEARMNEGRFRGTKLICPLHGAAFDVQSGQVLSGPATRPLTAHAVQVVDGIIQVALADAPRQECSSLRE